MLFPLIPHWLICRRPFVAKIFWIHERLLFGLRPLVQVLLSFLTCTTVTFLVREKHWITQECGKVSSRNLQAALETTFAIYNKTLYTDTFIKPIGQLHCWIRSSIANTLAGWEMSHWSMKRAFIVCRRRGASLHLFFFALARKKLNSIRSLPHSHTQRTYKWIALVRVRTVAMLFRDPIEAVANILTFMIYMQSQWYRSDCREQYNRFINLSAGRGGGGELRKEGEGGRRRGEGGVRRSSRKKLVCFERSIYSTRKESLRQESASSSENVLKILNQICKQTSSEAVYGNYIVIYFLERNISKTIAKKFGWFRFL